MLSMPGGSRAISDRRVAALRAAGCVVVVKRRTSVRGRMHIDYSISIGKPMEME